MVKPKSPLRITCVIGLILALILSWGLVLYGFIWGREAAVPEKAPAFTNLLREYDRYDAPARLLEGENPGQIERRLSALGRQARSAEDWLSVLKRRRALALLDRRYIPSYAIAAREAAEGFSYSAPIAAVMAEAVLMENPVIGEEARALLKTCAANLSQYRFDTLELGLHILAGDLEDIGKAAEIPGLVNLLSRELPFLSARDRRDLATDEFLLLARAGDIPGAALKMNALLDEAGAGSDGENYIRMGAEFFYDHKNPLRAAELFSRLSGEGNMARAADALVLAGEIPAARNIWLALVSPESANTGTADSLLTGTPPRSEAPAMAQNPARSFYNLAATSADKREETSWLEKSLADRSRAGESAGSTLNSTEILSVVRYTRLLDGSRAAAILEELARYPLPDLELLRRNQENLPPTRAAAEVWLLLGRHPNEESFHEWAAWYFGSRKLRGENAMLLKEAARKEMTGPWLDLHRSFALINDGKSLEAERLLRETYERETAAGGIDWRVPANLGRILEGRRAVSAALGFYEAAAALAAENFPAGKKTAALIQLRISRCREALGQSRESRRALETALELDPDNLNIRRELRRFDKEYSTAGQALHPPPAAAFRSRAAGY